MSELDYAFLQKRILWRKLWYRSLLYLIDVIGFCMYSLICWQKSDSAALSLLNLPQKWHFRKVLQQKFLKRVRITSHINHFNFYFNEHYKHCRGSLLKTRFIQNSIIFFPSDPEVCNLPFYLREMHSVTASGPLASFTFCNSQNCFV